GNFVISLPADQKYSFTISSIGYNAKTISDIEIKTGQVIEIEIVMEASSKNNLKDVTIKAAACKETTNAMISFQRNTAVVAQVVSAETIRRSPDKNTGEVLKRIPGTSIQEGKYLVVRGLADRYNQAMLNGILLSSTEPDRKTFSFDIFPA
ncbi:MAG: TonB-dependent receptor plug domain-containing protein, partial [Bacteroidota bacterium]